MELDTMNKKEKIETYSKEAVSAVKKILEGGGTATPYYYKTVIDGLKVIDRTSDISKFDSYELFLPGADELAIFIYASQTTPNYLLKRTFKMQNEKPQQQQALNGMELEGIINTKVNERVSLERERWDGDLTKKELETTKQKLAEAETYIDTLETQVAHFKTKKLHLGDINLGELASVVVEGMIRRNPQMLAKIPGGHSLAGIIEQDNKEKEEKLLDEPQGEASFTKKDTSLSEDDKRYLGALRELEESFDQEEFAVVMKIVQHLTRNTDDVIKVAEFLKLTAKPNENEKV
jgi:hypothetical protein